MPKSNLKRKTPIKQANKKNSKSKLEKEEKEKDVEMLEDDSPDEEEPKNKKQKSKEINKQTGSKVSKYNHVLDKPPKKKKNEDEKISACGKEYTVVKDLKSMKSRHYKSTENLPAIYSSCRDVRDEEVNPEPTLTINPKYDLGPIESCKYAIRNDKDLMELVDHINLNLFLKNAECKLKSRLLSGNYMKDFSNYPIGQYDWKRGYEYFEQFETHTKKKVKIVSENIHIYYEYERPNLPKLISNNWFLKANRDSSSITFIIFNKIRFNVNTITNEWTVNYQYAVFKETPFGIIQSC